MEIFIRFVTGLSQALLQLLLGQYADWIERRFPSVCCPQCRSRGQTLVRRQTVLFRIISFLGSVIFAFSLIVGGTMLYAGITSFGENIISAIGYLLLGLVLLLISLVSFGSIIWLRDRQPPISCSTCGYRWLKKV